jgi:hypothetical protein
MIAHWQIPVQPPRAASDSRARHRRKHSHYLLPEIWRDSELNANPAKHVLNRLLHKLKSPHGAKSVAAQSIKPTVCAAKFISAAHVNLDMAVTMTSLSGL